MPFPSETEVDGLAASSAGATSGKVVASHLNIGALAAAAFVLEVMISKSETTSHFTHVRAIEKKLYRYMSVFWDGMLKKGTAAACQNLSSLGHVALPLDTSGDVLATLQLAYKGWAKVASPILRAATAEAYRLGKQNLYKQAQTQVVEKAKKPQKTVEVKPHFALPDEQAISASTEKMLMWLGDFTARELPETISTIVKEIIIANGADAVIAAQELEKALAAKFGFGSAGAPSTPTAFKGDVHDYLGVVASYATSSASNIGAAYGLKELSITQFSIINPEDEKTCSLCVSMSGQVFETSDLISQIDSLMAATSIDGVKSIQPWAHTADEMSFIAGLSAIPEPGKEISQPDKDKLVAAGFLMCPYHGRCRCGLSVATGTELTF